MHTEKQRFPTTLSRLLIISVYLVYLSYYWLNIYTLVGIHVVTRSLYEYNISQYCHAECTLLCSRDYRHAQALVCTFYVSASGMTALSVLPYHANTKALNLVLLDKTEIRSNVFNVCSTHCVSRTFKD